MMDVAKAIHMFSSDEREFAGLAHQYRGLAGVCGTKIDIPDPTIRCKAFVSGSLDLSQAEWPLSPKT